MGVGRKLVRASTSASLKALDGLGVSVARAEIGNQDEFNVSFLTFGPRKSTNATGDMSFSVLYPECANKKDDDKDGDWTPRPRLLVRGGRGRVGRAGDASSGKVTIKPALRAGRASSVGVSVTVSETRALIDGGTTTCTVRRKGGARMLPPGAFSRPGSLPVHARRDEGAVADRVDHDRAPG